MSETRGPVLSVMLAVPDTPAAVEWYQRALGATVLWSMGPVAGLEIAGAAFFLGQPAQNGWESPLKLGITSCRVELFCDDPDAVVARAGVRRDGESGYDGGSPAALGDAPAGWVHRSVRAHPAGGRQVAAAPVPAVIPAAPSGIQGRGRMTEHPAAIRTVRVRLNSAAPAEYQNRPTVFGLPDKKLQPFDRGQILVDSRSRSSTLFLAPPVN